MAPPTYSLAESARRTRRTMPPMAATAATAWKTPRRRGRGAVVAAVGADAGMAAVAAVTWALDVQAGLVVVALDEVLARGHFLAHELREHAVGGHRVLDVDLEHDAPGGVHRRLPELLRVHLAQTLVTLDVDLAVLEAADVGVLLLIVVQPAGLLAVLDAVQRRLGDVEVAAVDQVAHVAEEEGEVEGADVGAVHVGVGHDNDAVVAELGGVELLAEAGAEGGDHRPYRLVGEHLVWAGLLDVEDLAEEREDRLEAAVAALLGGAAGGVALDDEQLAHLGVALGAIGELAGEDAVVEDALLDDEVAGLAGGVAGAGGGEALLDDAAAVGWVLLEVAGELLAQRGLDHPLELGVAQASLGLALELGLRDLDADDGDEPLADVFAAEVGVGVLEYLLLAGVVVEDAGEGGAEAGEVGAAVDRVDAVGEGEGGLREAIVVLQRYLHDGAVNGALHVERVVQGRAVPVEALHERLDAALEVVAHLVAAALVRELDPDALGEERHLAEALGQRLEIECDLGEDIGVWGEAGGSAAALGAVADDLELALRLAAGVFLAVDLAGAADLHPHGGGERVDHGGADAVQAAGHLVRVVVELAAGVEVGHHRLQGGLSRARVLVYRDAAAVVPDDYRAVGPDADVDLVAEAGHRLVDTVVDDLVDEVVETAGVSGADVHAGAAADSLPPPQAPPIGGGAFVYLFFGHRRGAYSW